MKRHSLQRRPLYRQIVTVLHDEIAAKLQPGDQIDAETKLAERFGVSVLTMREALRSLAQEGIIERRHGSGTYVSDHTKHQHVAILAGFDISQPRVSYYYLRMLSQLRWFFEQQGYRTKFYVRKLVPGESPRGEPNYPELVEDIEQNKIYGVVVIAGVPHPKWIAPLRKKRIPIVGSPNNFPFGVGIDYPELARQGTEFLLQQGRYRIAFLSWEGFKNEKGKREFLPSMYDRFEATMKKHGAPIHERWVQRDLHPHLTGAGWEEFREIWHAHEEKPDGLLVSDDILFSDVVVAIMELGIRVPDQLLVVTHAVKGSGILHPFPTIRLECDTDIVAENMGRMLVKLMRKEPVPQPKLYLSFRWSEALQEFQTSEATRLAGIKEEERVK